MISGVLWAGQAGTHSCLMVAEETWGSDFCPYRTACAVPLLLVADRNESGSGPQDECLPGSALASHCGIGSLWPCLRYSEMVMSGSFTCKSLGKWSLRANHQDQSIQPSSWAMRRLSSVGMFSGCAKKSFSSPGRSSLRASWQHASI